MNVTCPQCRTVYRLPDDKARAGARLRCSVCRHVFSLPEEEAAVETLSFGEEAAKAEKENGLEMTGLESSEVRAPKNDSLSLEDDRKPSGLDIAVDDRAKEAEAENVMEEQEGEQKEQEEAEASAAPLDMPEGKSSRFDGMLGMLLCAAIIGGGIWAWQNTNYLDGLKALVMPEATVSAPAKSAPAVEIIEKLELLDVTQYQVKNDKIGRLVVIEGKVRNNFDSARELISLEAELRDKDGNVLVTRRQTAGVSLSPFQLEALDKAELENTLNRKLDIVNANINVMPGAEVPFTVVFTEIPAGASDYKVRIVEAFLPKPVGNLTN